MTTLSIEGLFDLVYREARAAFDERCDIELTRESDALSEHRYVARLLGSSNDYIARGYGEYPEDALDALHAAIIRLARKASLENDACDREFRAQMPTLSPNETVKP